MAVSEEQQPTIQQILAALGQAMEAWGMAMRPVFAELAKAASGIYAGVRLAYEQAGSPYGPSDNFDNVSRWVGDLIETASQQRQREYQQQREQMVLETHAILASKRGRN